MQKLCEIRPEKILETVDIERIEALWLFHWLRNGQALNMLKTSEPFLKIYLFQKLYKTSESLIKFIGFSSFSFCRL